MPHEHRHIEKPPYRLSDFFDAHWENYLKAPAKPIKPEQFKAVNAIRTCRTAVKGIQIYACPDCGEVSEIYHACKHRFCPSCSWKDTLKWAERVHDNKLFKISHRHVVATIPHRLNPLFAQNYKQLNNALFRAASDTLKDWFAAKYSVTPGIVSVLHTFGEQKKQHNHVHMIVSVGGIHIKTKALKQVALDYIPFSFLSKKFRIKFEDRLIELFDNEQIKHNYSSKKDLLKLLKFINKKTWRFHIEAPMDDTQKVIRYIGRYSKRACLSERKIRNIQGEYISFEYKDYKQTDKNGKAQVKIKTMHYRDFFPTLLQHVPPIGFQIVRYYGAYANSVKTKPEYTAKQPKPNRAGTSVSGYVNPKICLYCNCPKQLIDIVFDKRKPGNRSQSYHTKKAERSIIQELKSA